MKVLWLASWYPNKYEPVNGDFIQRHAIAVSAFTGIDVFHVMQAGIDVQVEHEVAQTEQNGNLTEYIFCFPFKRISGRLVDKLRYNFIYFSYYKKKLDEYISKHGKPDIVHVHVPVKAGLLALYLQRKYGIGYIVSEQSSHYEPGSPEFFEKRSWFYKRNAKRVFENALAVTNVSATVGEKLRSFFRIKLYKTIHNLATSGLFYYRAGQNTNDTFHILHVSSLAEQKNPEGIIEALVKFDRQHPVNWHCTIAGPATDRLKAFAVKKEIAEKISFTGEVPYEMVGNLMQQADVFVLFSNHENFPCVVVEALCCGLPVISSDAGGVREAIDKTNGILVEKQNITGLSNAIAYVQSHRHEYDASAISAGALEKYADSVIGKQFANLYEEVLKTSTSSGEILPTL